MGRRPYRMSKRAEARDETRERILRATMSLHDEFGVATTSYSQIAERSGVGAATIYRNFPTLGDLVVACGAHVWRDMRPPVPQEAPAIFKGLATRAERLERLVHELDAFYRRGEPRLVRAAQDRHRVQGLDVFLTHVDAGIETLVREAMTESASEAEVSAVLALTDLGVWLSLRRRGYAKAELRRLTLKLIDCALASEESGGLAR